uniref:Uncharacterized protein n=1 Tax=Timema genevievae TaxID=629358 RepID=A0A7R9K462_TIMGE|nr:unnamed protein product [Timema genevievae]
MAICAHLPGAAIGTLTSVVGVAPLASASTAGLLPLERAAAAKASAFELVADHLQPGKSSFLTEGAFSPRERKPSTPPAKMGCTSLPLMADPPTLAANCFLLGAGRFRAQDSSKPHPVFFDKAMFDAETHLRDLDKRIEKTLKANRELDGRVIDLNVDVNEHNLQRDTELEVKNAEGVQRRMSVIVKRSRLITKIQEQYNDILVMQTELELLRLKTFPTLKYKTLF